MGRGTRSYSSLSPSLQEHCRIKDKAILSLQFSTLLMHTSYISLPRHDNYNHGMFQAPRRRCREVAWAGTLTVGAGVLLSLTSCARASMGKMCLDVLANLSVNSLASFS